jgi:hypothetical protein
MEAEIAVAGERRRIRRRPQKWKARKPRLSRYYAEDSDKLSVAAAKVDQRLTVYCVGMYDLAHDYRMVAARMFVHNAAL